MKRQSPSQVFFLTLVTFGIYHLFWIVDKKRSLCKLGANIPTSWLLIIPVGNLIWQWEFAKAVQWYTQKDMSATQTFFLLLSPFITRLLATILLWNSEDILPNALTVFLPLLVVASITAMIQTAFNTAITVSYQLPVPAMEDSAQ